MKKTYLAIICAVIGVFTIFWSIGVATNLFASSAFSAFWWISYEGAHYSEFVALSIGGAALLLCLNFWTFREKKN